MVSASVCEKADAQIWINQVEVLRQKDSGTLVFLCSVSSPRFQLQAELKEGVLKVRVGGEGSNKDAWQSEAVITASGDDQSVFSRSWWYFARSSGLGTVVLLDKHHWLRVGCSEILYKRTGEKTHVA